LAELCKTCGVRKYIFASSCSIYDQGVGDESKDLLLSELSEVRPSAAYSSSKYQAERFLLEMADDDFCPVILRKGTVYGFSPRMRYDLVVNTFVKDALAKGIITLHFGGEMWRPLVSVRDVARAYIAILNAPESQVHAEIFNVSYRNYRISELALRAREVLRSAGIAVDIKPDYSYKGVRSYRVSNQKFVKAIGIQPSISIEDSIIDMVNNIQRFELTDFDNPRYYNIRWMRMLEEANKIINVTGSVFGTGHSGKANL
jgi:nucleoside-diphosphate-sugar epimerase